MKRRLIGRHRPVTSVPHAAKKGFLIQTGIGFDGTSICLLVRPPKHPPDAVAQFKADFARMHKRASQVTLNDMYEQSFRQLNNG